MGEKCEVPVGIAENNEGKLVYVLCGEPAVYRINDWSICEKCRDTYPKQWPAILIEGA